MLARSIIGTGSSWGVRRDGASVDAGGSLALSAFSPNPLEAVSSRTNAAADAGGAASIVFARVSPSQPTTDVRPIGVIGAALDLGSGRRGVDMGPSAIRYALLG